MHFIKAALARSRAPVAMAVLAAPITHHHQHHSFSTAGVVESVLKITRNLLADGMLASVVLAAIGIGLAAVVATDHAGIRAAIAGQVKGQTIIPEVGEFDRIHGR